MSRSGASSQAPKWLHDAGALALTLKDTVRGLEDASELVTGRRRV